MTRKGALGSLVAVTAGLATLVTMAVLVGCNPSTSTLRYYKYGLVADTSGIPAARVDPNLMNAWGIAHDTTGSIYISANHSGAAVVYDEAGNQLWPPIKIPAADTTQVGAPSGAVISTTADFVIPGQGAAAKVLFSTEDGTISAWASGLKATTVVNQSAANAVYKGITIAANGGHNYIYAANFKGKKVDVFDNSFNMVTTMPFTDPNIPSNYGPFNVRNIGGKVYVTYAIPKPPDYGDDTAGPGNGFVDLYNPDGTLVKRLASNGYLNSPWGIAQAPDTFGLYSGDILVGNFGDGLINAWDSNGNYKGQLMDSTGNSPLTIDGLWDITFGVPGWPNWLYFSAGPQHEAHGLFGYVQAR